MDKLRRLWQPANPLFWLMLGFNLLSSLCTWAMRALPLNTLGLLVVGGVALFNVGFGLLAAWRLMQQPDESTVRPSRWRDAPTQRRGPE